MYVATEAFQAGIHYGIASFEAGAEIDDDLGRQLAEMGCPVQAATEAAPPAPAKKAAAKKTTAAKPRTT